MTKYKCMYEKGRGLNIGEDYTREIEANSEREAYLSYVEKIGIHDSAVLVTYSLPSGLLAKKLFDDHIDKIEVFKINAIQKATEESDFLISKKDDGYFKLQVREKINTQSYFDTLIEESGKRILFDEEIQYLKLWQGFKDREFGQNLLAQSEAQKPKDQQGQSPLGRMLLAGMAMSSMRLSQDIGAVSDQVENISEGMGFEG